VLVRVEHPDRSLWQSAVREVLAEKGLDASHPLAIAADADAQQPGPALERIIALAERSSEREGIVVEHRALPTLARAYSRDDPHLAMEVILKFVEWYAIGRRPVYRDWRTAGRNDIGFGVVEHRIAGDARVAVIGDWGTGLDDARAMLVALLRELRPAILVHLGDIYYSGTRRDAAHNFADVLDAAFAEVPPRIAVFNLPGNHDYYSGGAAFYSLLDRLNEPPARQAASYFCLRSAHDRWQLVGVDTGFHGRNPGVAFDPFATGPHLHDSETAWLRDKLGRFAGSTILLSHHPVFSARRAINGPRSGRRPAFNDRLHAAAGPHLDRVAAWLWGHEHSLAIYEDGQHGLAKGRLVGCSGFETGAGEEPYEARFPDVRLRQPEVRLSMEHGWYDHGFALIDLGDAAIEYYQFPAWGTTRPDSPGALTRIYRERLIA
jgi:Calcineurin-like phosphoesterase